MNFIFDIDGTICFDGNHIDQSIKIVLCINDENHKVIFASRSYKRFATSDS